MADEDDRELQTLLTGLQLELESLRKPGPSGLFVGGMVLTLASLGLGTIGLPMTLVGLLVGPGMFLAGSIMLMAGLIGIPVGIVLSVIGGVAQDAERRKFDAREAALKVEHAGISAELQRRSGEASLVAPASLGM